MRTELRHQFKLLDAVVGSVCNVDATVGLGWYFSDTLTRDEKQAYQRPLENEFNRYIKNQDDARKVRELEGSGRRLKKSAFISRKRCHLALCRFRALPTKGHYPFHLPANRCIG